MARIFNKHIKKFILNNGDSLRRCHQKKLLYSTLHRNPSVDINELLPLENSIGDELDLIEKNALLRKSDVNFVKIRNLIDQIRHKENTSTEGSILIEELKNELWKLPNQTHPDICNYNDQPKLLKKFNELPKFSFQALSFKELTKKLNLLRMEHLGNFNGHKSYYLMDVLSRLEHALIQYTLDTLKNHNFQLVSVPDILPAKIIEGCGMQTEGERTQVYKLNSSRKCLSGTSEIALAGYFSNEILNKNELPIKLTSVSRCYRAETSGLQEEKGIYRVHQFTKVEMFSICDEKQSDEILEQFRNIEIDLFRRLNLHFQLLDMPPSELGNPAYRKFDIESWMPGKKLWGEISSCSNCTDYQAKRLNIKYCNDNDNDNLRYVHTVNGTACAVPRMLIALLESFQKENGEIEIPLALQPYLSGMTTIKRNKSLPELKLVKSIKLNN